MVLALWAVMASAEPTPLTGGPVEGRLVGKDARDARDRPYDAYVMEPPAGVWVEVTVTGHQFPLRVRVGDEDVTFPAWFREPGVVRGWSAGGPLPIEVGTTDKALVGTYAVSVAFVAPGTSEPPVADRLPPSVKIEPTSWVDGGWFCDLVTVGFAEARTYTVSPQAEDNARMRVLVGRWEGGRLHVESDAVPAEGSRRPAPFEVRFAAGVPRVFGVCRDRLGTTFLDVARPGDDVAPGTVIDPSRKRVTLDEATAEEQAALEARMSMVVVESGEATRYEAFSVPLFLQSGLSYEAVVLTENDTIVPFARLYLAYCDETCEKFAAKAGMPMSRDGSWYVLDLPDSDDTQTWAPSHTERWRFTWPVGTTLNGMLEVTVRAVDAQRVRVVVGEE